VLTNAQDNQVLFKSFYVETGADFISCSAPDNKDYIRGDVIPYYYYYETSNIRALLYKNYVGVKIESRILNNTIGLLTGLRYTWTHGSIGKNTYWESNSDYLYLLYKQNGTTTEFLKVKSITQVSGFAGIPVEVRIYPYKNRKIQMYYKIGADFNFRVTNNTQVSFKNPAMESYADDITNLIEDPWKAYATVYAAIGMKIGQPDKPGLNIEATIPSAIICNYKQSFVSPEAGAGFQLNVRIPF
jgi:hypothetical protein